MEALGWMQGVETGSLVASSCCSIFGIWWLYVHHAVQLLLAMATILIMVFAFKQKPLSKWGFNFNNHTWSLLTVLKFGAGWIVITFLLNLYSLLFFSNLISVTNIINNTGNDYN